MHRFFVRHEEDVLNCTRSVAVNCVGCGLSFRFEMANITIREAMQDTHSPNWPLQVMATEMAFLNEHMPCIYAEAATG